MQIDETVGHMKLIELKSSMINGFFRGCTGNKPKHEVILSEHRQGV
jgi:hypothetical protein